LFGFRSVFPEPQGTGGTCPHFYKRLDTGDTVRQTRNWPECSAQCSSRNRSPKRLLLHVEQWC